MNRIQQPPRAILVIANETCSCPALADEVAGHPPGRSNWLERGLIETAGARFTVPVTHLVSGYGLVEEAAAT